MFFYSQPGRTVMEHNFCKQYSKRYDKPHWLFFARRQWSTSRYQVYKLLNDLMPVYLEEILIFILIFTHKSQAEKYFFVYFMGPLTIERWLTFPIFNPQNTVYSQICSITLSDLKELCYLLQIKYQYKHFKNIKELDPFSNLLFYLQTF